jgi:hypothetical protein
MIRLRSPAAEWRQGSIWQEVLSALDERRDLSEFHEWDRSTPDSDPDAVITVPNGKEVEFAMLKMAVGHTEEFEADLAAADLIERCNEALGDLEPQAGWLLASHDLDLEALVSPPQRLLSGHRAHRMYDAGSHVVGVGLRRRLDDAHPFCI